MLFVAVIGNGCWCLWWLLFSVVRSQINQGTLTCELTSTTVAQVDVGVECSADGILVQENSVLYEFDVPKDANFNIIITMDTIVGDPDFEVLWPSKEAYQGNLGSEKFGVGTAIDSVFVSQTLLESNPGIWNINISSFTPSSTYNILLIADNNTRTLNSEDFEVLKSVVENCCSDLRDICPLLRSSISAYQAGEISNDLCHSPGNLCDEEGHITHLNLENQGLSCNFPKEFGRLNYLQELNLAYNRIYGQLNQVSTVVQNFDELRWLNLASNSLTGTIPCEIAPSSLRLLALTANQLSGTIPSCIVNLPNLVELLFTNTGINGTFPAFEKTSQLAVIYMDDLQLEGPVPNFEKAPNLMIANLNNNQFSGSIPQVPDTLWLLRLGNNRISGQLPESLQFADHLEALEINNNYLTGSLPEFIVQLPKLQILDIQSNNITDAIPSNWTGPALTTVKLGNNLFSGTLPATLALLPNLRLMSLFNNLLSGDLSEFGKAIPQDPNNLHAFEINGNQFSGSLPPDLSRLRVFSEDYLKVRKRTISGYSLAPIPNKFYVQDNNFSGVIPEYIMLSLTQHAHLWVNTTSNNLLCPDKVSPLILPNRMFSINCTYQGQEISLLAHLTLNPNTPDTKPAGIKNWKCKNNIGNNKDDITVFQDGVKCQNTDVVLAGQTHMYGFYVVPGVEYDLKFILILLEGEAELYIDWNGRLSTQQPIGPKQSTLNHKVETLILSRTYMQRQAGWWYINVTSFSEDSIYELTVEAVDKVTTLHQDDKQVLSQVADQCCSSQACQLLKAAIGAPEVGILQDLCFRPPNRCDANGHVTHLSLENEGLVCQFPNAIKNLALESLQLSGNYLNGTLKEAMAALPPTVTWLDLSSNLFSGELVCDLLIPQLETLSLSYNMLQGTFPQCKDQENSKLNVLLISGNRLEGSFPKVNEQIALRALKIFGAKKQNSQNGFTGQLPDLQAMKMLMYVDFSNNFFSGTLPVLPQSLKILRLQQNRISGKVPELYTALVNIDDVDISNNEIQGTLPEFFVGLPQLQILNASNNFLSGLLPDLWMGSKIASIYLQGNQFSGQIPAALAQLSTLKVLNLSKNNLNGTLYNFASAITNDSRLLHFDISFNSLSGSIPTNMHSLGTFTDNYMFSESNPTLSHLTVRTPVSNVFNISSNLFTGTIPEFILRVMPELMLEVNISNNLIQCPQAISWKLIDKYVSFRNIVCLDAAGENVVLTKYLLPTQMSKKLQCTMTNYTSSSYIVSSSTEACIGDGSIQQNQSAFFEIYVDGREDIDVEFDLSMFDGDAEMYVVWKDIFQTGNSTSFSSTLAGSGQTSEYIFIPRDVVSAFPGWWTVQIKGMSMSTTFNLVVRPVVEERNLSTADKTILYAIQNRCCKEPGSCVRLNELLSDTNSKDFCYEPPNACNAQGHITYLDLSYQDLSCSFPVEISQLQFLKSLDVSFNKFFGDLNKVSFPSSVRWLKLQSNSLNGSLSCDIFTQELQLLSLSNNQITGSIPSCIFQASPKLAQLELDRNFLRGELNLPVTAVISVIRLNSQHGSQKLTGTIPNLQLWKYLLVLDVGYNQFFGTVPEINDAVVYLDISNNQFTGRIPESYDNIVGLQTLKLNSNRLSGNILGGFGSMSNLQTLDLSYNLLTGQIPSVWINTATMIIVLDFNNLIGTLPVLLATLPKLQQLSIRNNSIGGQLDKFANSLRQENNLRWVDLSNNRFSGEIPSALSRLAIFGNDSIQNYTVVNDAEVEFEGFQTVNSKFLSVENNYLVGQIPNWMIASKGQNTTVKTAGNQIICPSTKEIQEAYYGITYYVQQSYLKQLECLYEDTFQRGTVLKVYEEYKIANPSSSLLSEMEAQQQQQQQFIGLNSGSSGRNDDGFRVTSVAIGLVGMTILMVVSTLTYLQIAYYFRKNRIATFKKHLDEATSSQQLAMF